eukprot:Sspe_Gene.98574::Locus_71973_Transcript_1_1_Confidence_1.000_Length_1014::g.98574::m.98574/K02206/CDK2; cyclin-dependent kinase 2
MDGVASNEHNGEEKWMQYEQQQKLGTGVYGIVYKARNLLTGEQCALKKLKLEHQDGLPATGLREIALLRYLKHPNVVRLLDVMYIENKKLMMVFEYVQGDLQRYHDLRLKSRKPFSKKEVQTLAQQILRGLAYVHSRGILHRDLKPHNILLAETDNGLVAKLCDFGISRPYNAPLKLYTREVVTLWYRAPEIMLTMGRYTKAIDVFSVGCIVAELTNGRPLFRGDSEIGQLFHIFQIMGTPRPSTWPDFEKLDFFRPGYPSWDPLPPEKVFTTPQHPHFYSFIYSILELNPAARASAVKALRHPYFTIDFDNYP